MIVLSLFDEVDEKTGKKTGKKLVSHGINTETMEGVTLPNDRPEEIGVWSNVLNEWVLRA